MYGHSVTESNEESTKTISTTNVWAEPVENYAKTGHGYAKIQYISYSYAEDIKVNGKSIVGFKPEKLEYSVAVPKTETEVQFDVTKGADYQTVTTSTDFDLTEKINKKYITVTAKDGTETTYTINIEYEDARLASLEIENGTLTQKFNPDKYEYNLIADPEFDWINIKGTPVSKIATVTGNGKYTIEVGTQDITIQVKTYTGDVASYILHVTRKGSSYAYLQDIKVNGNSLENYKKETYYYEIPVDIETKSVDLEAIKYRVSQEVTLPSDLRINSGENRKEIVVVSEDKTQVNTYVLNFIKEHSSKLKSLKFGDYSFKEEFDPYVYEYNLEIAKGTIALHSKYEVYDEEAVVKITGNGYITENTTIIVKVTEPHCQETTYKIKVVKEQSPEEEIKTTFKYTGDIQTFIAPYSGTYKLEVWGAQGGTTQGYLGGFGAYSYGEIWLNKGEILYVGVGGAGTRSNKNWTSTCRRI